MRTYYLGNDWSIRREQIKSQGVLVDGVPARGLISAAPDGVAIDATLEDGGTITAGVFDVTMQGTDMRTHLEPLLEQAEIAGRELLVYDRVIVDDEDYSDYVPVRVKRARPAGEP